MERMSRCKLSVDAYLADRPVSLCEVRLQEGVKQVACQALNGVINWQDMDALAILDICALQTQTTLWHTAVIADASGSCTRHVQC